MTTVFFESVYFVLGLGQSPITPVVTLLTPLSTKHRKANVLYLLGVMDALLQLVREI